MSTPCQKGGMRLSEALDNMQLAYNPITKQLHFVSPKVEKPPEDTSDDVDKLSKKSSFSDEGNFSLSTCEKSDTSDSPKSTLQWGGSVSGHQRGKDGGSFSSTVSSLSECSLGSSASKEDEVPETTTSDQDQSKLKKKGLSGFFSRGVFPWKSSSKSQEATSPTVTWRLFGSKSTQNLAAKTLTSEVQKSLTPVSSATSTPHHHKRQGSSASEKQFEDLVASSIALIQHDRPSNLPAKCTEEALRHKAEHARMVEAARRRVEREAAARHARLQESLRVEERLARHAKEWTQNILPDWQNMKNNKRTLELWWSGLPPSIRGKVWQLAIENKLKITHQMYQEYVAKAKQKLHEAQLRRKRLKVNNQETCDCDSDNVKFDVTKEEKKAKTDERTDEKPRLSIPRNLSEQNLKSHSTDSGPKKCCSKSNPNLLDYSDECSMELIQLDIARTFPHLCIFQPGGPYFDVLHELLAAYVCYRPDIGYIQGMSFIAAVLILNMEAPQAFVCFANLLDGPVLRAAFTRDGNTMQRLWQAYGLVARRSVPALESLLGRLAPELYLLEWLYTAFAKAMPLDAACRIWDLFLRDGGTFLFAAAVGILHLYQDELKDMDFITAAQFLTKLPEDLDTEALFRSISTVSLSVDGMTFEELVSCCELDTLDEDVTVRL
ncbi:TBC1 domain family member 12-like [Galleria mellonella]|uniref:TBC1 domain family member 12-like n=1 Tax=Galleria mellonella TaxID=7137 RepID=A0ABM3MF19_GALME|nr:TBC1 domain family member 12-like [Galleria mellonella]